MQLNGTETSAPSTSDRLGKDEERIPEGQKQIQNGLPSSVSSLVKKEEEKTQDTSGIPPDFSEAFKRLSEIENKFAKRRKLCAEKEREDMRYLFMDGLEVFSRDTPTFGHLVDALLPYHQTYLSSEAVRSGDHALVAEKLAEASRFGHQIAAGSCRAAVASRLRSPLVPDERILPALARQAQADREQEKGTGGASSCSSSASSSAEQSQKKAHERHRPFPPLPEPEWLLWQSHKVKGNPSPSPPQVESGSSSSSSSGDAAGVCGSGVGASLEASGEVPVPGVNLSHHAVSDDLGEAGLVAPLEPEAALMAWRFVKGNLSAEVQEKRRQAAALERSLENLRPPPPRPVAQTAPQPQPSQPSGTNQNRPPQQDKEKSEQRPTGPPPSRPFPPNVQPQGQPQTKEAGRGLAALPSSGAAVAQRSSPPSQPPSPSPSPPPTNSSSAEPSASSGSASGGEHKAPGGGGGGAGSSTARGVGQTQQMYRVTEDLLVQTYRPNNSSNVLEPFKSVQLLSGQIVNLREIVLQQWVELTPEHQARMPGRKAFNMSRFLKDDSRWESFLVLPGDSDAVKQRLTTLQVRLQTPTGPQSASASQNSADAAQPATSHAGSAPASAPAHGPAHPQQRPPAQIRPNGIVSARPPPSSQLSSPSPSPPPHSQAASPTHPATAANSSQPRGPSGGTSGQFVSVPSQQPPATAPQRPPIPKVAIARPVPLQVPPPPPPPSSTVRARGQPGPPGNSNARPAPPPAHGAPPATTRPPGSPPPVLFQPPS